MPPAPRQSPLPPLDQITKKTLAQKIAHIFYLLTIVCTAIAGIVLISKAGLVLFGTLFALADAAGAPNSSGFALFDIVPFFAQFLWISDAPLLELLGILLITICITRLLYKKKFYASASVAAVVLLVVATPFARAAVYFSTSNAQLPLFASGVDTLSYRTLSTNPQVEGRYSLDKNHVYCSNQILPDADPSTFSIVPGQDAFGDYGKDAQHVWWSCQEIPNADPATFSIIDTVPQGVALSGGGEYAKDSHAVYFQGQVIADADPTTYQILSDTYAKDKNHVWGGDYIIPNADPNTFQILISPSTCYLNQDPNCPPDAKDSKQLYLHGQVIGQVH